MTENLPIHSFKADENEEVLLIHDPENRTFWASQKQMAVMFGVTTDNISLRLMYKKSAK